MDHTALAAMACLLAWAAPPLAADAANAEIRCSVQSSTRIPLLVELYTSEGCSSCPPADRWMSGLQGRHDLVALSLHVDYWDRLGWKDRFSSPAHSQRQMQLLRGNGARYAYTPQVLVDGLDQPRWSGLRLPLLAQRPMASVQAILQRDGTAYTAELRPLPGAPAQLAGFWALTEDGHASTVKSGENRGATLAHDFVVREYVPIAAWDARDGVVTRLRFSPATPAHAAHPRQVNLVLVDACSGRPLQALKLGC